MYVYIYDLLGLLGLHKDAILDKDIHCYEDDSPRLAYSDAICDGCCFDGDYPITIYIREREENHKHTKGLSGLLGLNHKCEYHVRNIHKSHESRLIKLIRVIIRMNI